MTTMAARDWHGRAEMVKVFAKSRPVQRQYFRVGDASVYFPVEGESWSSQPEDVASDVLQSTPKADWQPTRLSSAPLAKKPYGRPTCAPELLECKRTAGRASGAHDAASVTNAKPPAPAEAAALDSAAHLLHAASELSVEHMDAELGVGPGENKVMTGPRLVGTSPAVATTRGRDMEAPTVGTVPSPWRCIVDRRQGKARHLPCPWKLEDRLEMFTTARCQTKWIKPRGMPRNTAWMVQDGCSCCYEYSRHRIEPAVFPPWLLEFMERVMPLCGLSERHQWPNCCNLNLYETGSESAQWHSDDEKLFATKDNSFCIISLSLGATCTFEIKESWAGAPTASVALRDGDILTMEGQMQKHFKHRVPKEQAEGPRINLTWRWISTHQASCVASTRGAQPPVSLPIL